MPAIDIQAQLFSHFTHENTIPYYANNIYYKFFVFFIFKTKQKQLIIVHNQLTLSLKKLQKSSYQMHEDLKAPLVFFNTTQKEITFLIARKEATLLNNKLLKTSLLLKSTYDFCNNKLYEKLLSNNMVLFRPEILELKPVIQQILFDFKNTTFHDSFVVSISEYTLVKADLRMFRLLIKNLIMFHLEYLDTTTPIHISGAVYKKNKYALTIKKKSQIFYRI